MNIQELKKMANEVRKNILVATHAAKSGHPGGSLSAAEVYTYLYFQEMNIDPKNPKDPDRDRFVLSKGHTAPGLYSTLALRDQNTGSLGQGVSSAVGMAMFAKMNGKSFRTYALLGDGEIEEGLVWEAAMFAGYRKLDNLCLIVDNNNLQIDGPITEVCSPYPIDEKFRAFNFHVINVADGNDMEQIAAAFKEARETKGAPSVIVMKTVKGKGVSYMENQVSWHGVAPDDEQFRIGMEDLEKIGEAL